MDLGTLLKKYPLLNPKDAQLIINRELLEDGHFLTKQANFFIQNYNLGQEDYCKILKISTPTFDKRIKEFLYVRNWKTGLYYQKNESFLEELEPENRKTPVEKELKFNQNNIELNELTLKMEKIQNLFNDRISQNKHVISVTEHQSESEIEIKNEIEFEFEKNIKPIKPTQTIQKETKPEDMNTEVQNYWNLISFQLSKLQLESSQIKIILDNLEKEKSEETNKPFSTSHKRTSIQLDILNEIHQTEKKSFDVIPVLYAYYKYMVKNFDYRKLKTIGN